MSFWFMQYAYVILQNFVSELWSISFSDHYSTMYIYICIYIYVYIHICALLYFLYFVCIDCKQVSAGHLPRVSCPNQCFSALNSPRNVGGRWLWSVMMCPGFMLMIAGHPGFCTWEYIYLSYFKGIRFCNRILIRLVMLNVFHVCLF